jgi:membrane protein implicated in regulation of membrane protease activity
MLEGAFFQNILDLWNALDGFAKVYWVLAIPSTVLFLIQMVMLVFGFDSDSDTSFDDGGDDLSGFTLFSVRNIIIFVTVFSWSGITGTSSGWNAGITLLISFILALIVMFLVAWMFKKMSTLGEVGNFDISKAKGCSATVYIPLSGQSKGKVQAKIDGRLMELEAVSDSEEIVATGTLVEIIEVIDKSYVKVKVK